MTHHFSTVLSVFLWDRPEGSLLLNMLIKNEEEHLERTLPGWAKIIGELSQHFSLASNPCRFIIILFLLCHGIDRCMDHRCGRREFRSE